MKIELKSNFTILIVVFSVFFLNISIYGKDISIQSKVDKNKITIGDYIYYSLIIEYSKDLKLSVPGLAANLGMFEIKDYNVKPTLEKNGKKKEEFIYKISTYTTGEYEIPGITIEYEKSGKKKTIHSNSIKIKVESVSKNDKLSDIKDLKELYVPEKSYKNLIIIVVSIIVIFVILFSYYLYRKNKLSNEVEYEEVLTDYSKIYNGRLDKIEGEISQDNIKEKYFEIDDILRKYISIYTGTNIMELTTYEISKRFSLNLPDKMDRNDFFKLKKFMEHADMIKFAKYPQELSDAKKDIDFVKKYISDNPIEPVKELKVKGRKK